MPQKRIIKTGSFKLASIEWGKGFKKRVLALHGWLDNANSFLPLEPYLQGLHVVALDLIGHGHSDHRPKGCAYHFIDAVSLIHTVLDTLEWDTCSLLGHSMGGGISVLAAGTFPKRIEKLALIEALGPFSRAPEQGPEFLLKHIESTLALAKKKLPSYSSKEAGAIARKAAGDFSIEISRTLCERGLKKKGTHWTWRTDPRLLVESPMRLSEDQVQAYLRRVKCPTLLLIGKNGLKFDATLMAQRKDLIQNLKFVELDGGHHLHMESPDNCARIIQDFL